MSRAATIILALVLCAAVYAGGFRPAFRGEARKGTATTVHDTLQGPVITIVTPDSVAYSDSWKFKATVAWGDGEEAEVSCYVRLDSDYDIMPVGYLRAASWDGELFGFDSDEYANLVFRDEADDSLEFTVYAIDDNGMSDVATKTVVYYLP